jgi:hypothetical protein
MAEGRTAVMVALIGMAGVIGAALIANADKLFGERPHPVPSATTMATATITDARPGPATVPPVAPDPGVAAAPPDVSGVWFDDDGTRFVFSQQGADYSFVQFADGRAVGGGSGTLAGRAFSHRFRAERIGEGSCSGSVAADGQTSSGHCRADRGGDWDYTVHR